jgi:hypothetical protein
MDKGRNAGITGIVDITGAPQFTAKVMKFSMSGATADVDTTGQGSDGESSSRAGDENGGLVITAEVRRDGFPVPQKLANAIGTIKIQMDVGIYATETVRVQSYKCDFDEAKESIWRLAIVCTRISATVWTGWKGTQSNPNPPAAKSTYLYSGRQKVVDKNTIVDNSAMTIDVSGLTTDTDAGEIARLASVLTAFATPPQSGEKLYTSTVTRTDATGMRVALVWKPNDSVDDIVFPATSITTDPKGLTDRGTSAAVDAVAPAPSGQIKRSVTAYPKTPAHTLNVTESGLRTTQEDLEFPETYVHLDPLDLTNNGQTLTVFPTGTPPSDPAPPSHTKIVEKWSIQLTSQGTPKSYEVWRFEPQTSVDKIEQGETIQRIDLSGLETSGKSVRVDATASAITGTIPRFTTTQKLSDWHTKNGVEYGLRTTSQDIEFPGTFVDIDLRGITTNGKTTIVFPTASPPSDPAAPSGTKQTGKAFYQYTASGTSSPQSYGVWRFNAKDSQDEIEFSKTFVSVDPLDIKNTAAVATVSSGSLPSLPANLVLVADDFQTVVDGKIVTIARYGTQTSVQEIQNRNSSSERSAIQPWNDAICAVLTTTSQAATVASAEWAAHQSDPNLLKLSVEKIDPNTARVIYFYYNPGILVEGYTIGVSRKVRARNNSGDAQVYVATNKSRGSGSRLIQLSEQWVTSIPLRRFVVRRLLTGTVIPENIGILGMVNNATFLGLSAGTVVYEGPIYSTNISLSGTLPFFMGYQMSSDANGFFDGPPETFFQQPLLLATSSTATGWVNAAALGLDGYMNAPDSGDFSPIVS